VAQEYLSKIFADGFGVDVVMTRSFNHVGPGQSEQFVVSSFAKQMVLAKMASQTQLNLRAGNTSVIRDFLDVRDVVRAYALLFEFGRSGEVYNVCSGVGRSLDSVLETLSGITGLELLMDVDSSLFRPNELMEMVGSAKKLAEETGWKPEIDFEESLRDLVAYWQQRLRQGAS